MNPARSATLRFLLVSLSLLGCSVARDGSQQAPASSAGAGIPDPPAASGYPRGPWWISDLSGVMLCARHVLVAHTDSKQAAGNLHLVLSRNPRTRAGAFELATRLANQLKQQPNDFADTARKYSDDATTRGSLGGLLGCGGVADFPGPVVDALGNLGYDEVSEVVESPLGYHVVQRLREVPEELVSAREVAIVYRESEAATFARNEVARTRTRDEARTLAQALQTEVTAHPERIAALADKHSDTFRNRGGTYGVWSTRELDAEPVVLALVRALPVGGVSEVVEDTAYGFRFFYRDEPGSPRLFAHRTISFSHEGTPASREQARVAAESALAEVTAKPALFDEAPERLCGNGACSKAFTYREGRSGIRDLEERLDKVPVGGVVPELLHTGQFFEIVRREAPTTLPRTASRFALPRPERKTMDTASTKEFEDYLDFYVGNVKASGRFSAAQWPEFEAIMATLKDAIGRAPVGERAGLVAETNQRIAKLFGPTTAAELAVFDVELRQRLQGMLKQRGK